MRKQAVEVGIRVYNSPSALRRELAGVASRADVVILAGGSEGFRLGRAVCDACRNAILIFTGEKDFRIPYTQSLEAFTAARVLGIPARLVAFENEAHQVFKPQNALVWNREFFGWLDKYVK